MVCSHCNKVALYVAQGRGYCGDHKAQAVAHTADLGRYRQSARAVAEELSRNEPFITSQSYSQRLYLKRKAPRVRWAVNGKKDEFAKHKSLRADIKEHVEKGKQE
jgi:hypothetical protein